MPFFRMKYVALMLTLALAFGFTVCNLVQPAGAQETTGALQGTIKDASGAVVPGATVTVTTPALIGSKVLTTDSSGYFHFANLPPGTYTIVVSTKGFDTLKRDNVTVEVGHVPTLDLVLKIGEVTTVVEVNTSGPQIDTTTVTSLTNIPQEELQNTPHGISFQSVIQFAPMARNEPLAGMSQYGGGTGGNGGSMPGSSGNGNGFGYSIGGAADSESSYLVEGQDTENISGGYSKANVPMDFIQEVEMKTSGVGAEYGGALGGVVNVILKKGSNDFHGEFFSTYESSGTDANPVNAYLRYDPTQTGTDCPAINAAEGCPSVLRVDPNYQLYQAQKAHFRAIQPGVLVGGPIKKDRLWFVTGFNPLYNAQSKFVNFGANDNDAGIQYFTQDKQTSYSYMRLDAVLTQKIRVYGSWLYQYAREAGDSMPLSDPIAQESGILNTSTFNPLTEFSHGLGFSAPNATYNVGADISLTQKLVSTTRYGYFFDNYHDFGWPTAVADLDWGASGAGANDNAGNPLPAALAQDSGTQTQPYNQSYTLFNSDKHYQFNEDIAFYKAGWAGTHNLKFGYQLNHLVNIVNQNGNVPLVYVYPGSAQYYGPYTAAGGTACSKLTAKWGECAGQYGFVTIQDFATILTNSAGAATPASDWNHALYVQDSWTIGKGLTLDLGLRIEKESLPAPGGVKVSSINFPWSDKIEPRLGAAWDPRGNGKMKFFGSYGVVNDVMKLLLAQTSWGAQAYEDCTYPLGPDGTSAGFSSADYGVDVVFKNNRACPTANPTTGANFANNQVPQVFTDTSTKTTLIENANFRPWEPVAPNVKPYRQHEYVIGWDYQIAPGWAFEARYDRRRLDHVIEDASLSDRAWGEIYTVVNPGEGVNSTLDGYATYLASLGQSFGITGEGYAFNDTADNGPGAAFGTCPSCPAMPKAIRNYDGLEFRIARAPSRGLSGTLSYTYSSLWGNYTGLTTTDQTDGGITGRNSPDTTRSFDEPFYYFTYAGKSNSGPLPTDRPNVIKGNVYYQFPWKRQTTTVGLFQQFYQGSPVSSYIDLFHGEGNSAPYEATYFYGRGNWVPTTTDGKGNITLGTPYSRRTPWFIQSDLNASEAFKIGDSKTISFEATAINALNERAVTAYWGAIDSMNFSAPLTPGGYNLYSGAALYQAAETGYNPQSLINAGSNPVVQNSQYGKPYLYQLSRNIHLGVHYTF
jgi:hypothetical protein